MSEFNQRARSRIRPHIVQVAIMPVTLDMANTQSPNAHAVAITPITPVIDLTTPAQTPKVVTVTLVTPTVVLV